MKCLHELDYRNSVIGTHVGLRENVSEVASVKYGSTLSTATNNINTRTEHSMCTPKIVSYADAVRTRKIGSWRGG